MENILSTPWDFENQSQLPATQGPANDRQEEYHQSDIYTNLIGELMNSNAPPALVDYYRYISEDQRLHNRQLPQDKQLYVELLQWFLGWTELQYVGPQTCDPFLDRLNSPNPRQPNMAHVHALEISIRAKKLDHRFPLDLLVELGSLSNEMLHDMKVDGSRPDVVPPTFFLLGQTDEEKILRMQIWMQLDMTGTLEQSQIQEKIIQLNRLRQRNEYSKAVIAAGKHRDLAMQQVVQEVVQTQHEICDLAANLHSTMDEDYLEMLVEQQKAKMEQTKFRARIWNAAMPDHLKAELAKNFDSLEQRGPSLGENIYMFSFQTRDIIQLLEEAHPHQTHKGIMNIWHEQHIANQKTSHDNSRQTTSGAGGSGQKDSKNDISVRVGLGLGLGSRAERSASEASTERGEE
ncbi:hypothetical protein BDV93DRAFT_516109 [Ceratobasidium sp. AG-I]|nr:hypothetical protein BDV93DRAFT_516109 [Ceratobasidium sp. AG-I]